MSWKAGWAWDTKWIVMTLALYALCGACWLPVVWLQVKMAKIAQTAQQSGGTMPAQYWRYAKIWELLGYPAFCATLVIYFLMVMKPA